MKTMRKISVVVLMFYYTTGVGALPCPEREKGEISLEVRCDKDTFRTIPHRHGSRHLPVSPDISGRKTKRDGKTGSHDPITISAGGFSWTGFFTGSLCSVGLDWAAGFWTCSSVFGVHLGRWPRISFVT